MGRMSRWITSEERLYHGTHANLCNARVFWLCSDKQGGRRDILSLDHARFCHSLLSPPRPDRKFCFHSTRTDNTDFDAMWTKLAVKCLSESHLREFGRAIDRFSRKSHHACH